MANSGITKKDLLLGKDSETLIRNADENFDALFDAVDDLNEEKEPNIGTKNSAFNKNFSDSTPNMDGTGSAGEADTVSRSDHTHPTDTSRLGVKPDGTNNLIENNKINIAYIPDSVLGQLEYQGTFNASTAVTKDKTKGHYYICAIEGDYNPDGTEGNTYAVGDWAVYNGSSWDKVDNTDAVTMVNGQKGAVKTYKGAYDSGKIYNQGDIVLWNECLYLYINGDSVPKEPSNTDYWKIFGKVYSNATQSESGLMSATDKQTLEAIPNTYAKNTDLHSHDNKAVINKFTEDDKGNLQYDEKPVGAVKDVQIDGTTIVKDGIANIKKSDIKIDVEALKALYDEVAYNDSRWTNRTINGTLYDAIVIEDNNIVYDVLNEEGLALVTQIVRDEPNKKLYLCFIREKTKTKSYFLRQLSGNGVGGSGILDYTLLPPTSNNNLDEKAIYRVPRATFYSKDKGTISSSEMCCNIMNELPSVGNPCATFDSNFNVTHIETYFIPATTSHYAYVDDNLASIDGSLSVGWHHAQNLFRLINVDFGGITYAIDHAVSGTIYLWIRHDLYSLKNGRFELINVSEDKKYQWNNSQTFKKEVAFEKEVNFGSQSQVSFEGAVDFSSAEISGLSSGGGVLTKRKVTLAELQSLITTGNMGMYVSIICKSSTLRDYNGLVAPMLKIGYSTLSTNAPEIFNRYIYSITDSFYNGASVIQFNEFLLRITKSGVIFNNYIYRINKTTLEFTTSTEALKTNFTDDNFDFYVFV